MRITGLDLYEVQLTSHATYYMASGKTCDTVPTMIVELSTDTGLTGWGEVCPIPHYLPAYAKGVGPALEEMGDLLIGADPIGPEALVDRLDRHLPGHVYAKSAIDIALWDLTGKAVGQPLYRLLGGRHQDDLPLYHSLTCVAPDEMARMAREAQAVGIGQFQVKLGADGDWQADVERLRRVREAVGDGPLVYGDWNCGATRLFATRVGRAVAGFDIMLEQPCATLEDCAAVRAATGLPIKIDENAHDQTSLRKAHELGILDAVAIKLSKFGGLSASRRARDLAIHLGAILCVEDTWGSDIATTAALHLGAATPERHLMNVCDLSGYVGPRIAPDGPARDNGRIRPPDGPGLGITPDRTVLGSPILSLN